MGMLVRGNSSLNSVKMSSKLQASAALSHGKEPPVPVEWAAGWTAALIWILRRKISRAPAEKSAAISRSSILFVRYHAD
jgi:hypothetical protein